MSLKHLIQNIEASGKESESVIKRRKTVSIISFFILIILSFLIAWYIGKPMINLVSEPEGFKLWVKSHGFGSQIIFILMQILQVVIAIIPGEPLELGAGYAFGAIEGTVLCLVGNLIGGIIIFSIVRKWGIKFIELFFPREKILSLKFLQDEKKLNLLIYILFLLPGTPKDLLSYFAGLTNIRWSKWLIITSIARLPSIITSTLSGGALSKGNYKSAVFVFIVSAVLSILGLLIYNKISKHHNEILKIKEKEKTNASN